MKNTKKTVFVLTFLLLIVSTIHTEIQFMDILYLRDGRSMEGLIIDRLPGISVKLETPEKTVFTFEMDAIEKIESKKSDERIKVRNVDAVFLNDGIVFRGTIIRQVPNFSLTLETESGLLLPFPIEEIWKIITTKRIEDEGNVGKTVENEVESFKIALQLEIGKNTLDKIKEPNSSEKDQSDTDLQDEVTELQKELKSLQDQQVQIEMGNSARRNAKISEDIEELQQNIKELMDKLLKQAQECENLDESIDEENVSFWKGGSTKLRTKSPLSPGKHCQSDKNTTDKTGEKNMGSMDEDLEVLENQFSMLLDGLSVHAAPFSLEDEINALEENAGELSTRLQLEEILGSGKLTLHTRFYSRWMVDELSLDDRLFLYESYKRRDIFKGVLLNSVPFLYIGSWAQGDWFGALTGYALFVLNLGIYSTMQAGHISGGSDFNILIGHDENGYYYYRDYPTEEFLIVFGLLSISYAHSLLQPMFFVNRRNKRLSEFLKLDKSQIRRESSAVTVNPPTFGITMTSDNKLKVQVKLLSLQY